VHRSPSIDDVWYCVYISRFVYCVVLLTYLRYSTASKRTPNNDDPTYGLQDRIPSSDKMGIDVCSTRIQLERRQFVINNKLYYLLFP